MATKSAAASVVMLVTAGWWAPSIVPETTSRRGRPLQRMHAGGGPHAAQRLPESVKIGARRPRPGAGRPDTGGLGGVAGRERPFRTWWVRSIHGRQR
ncbi:hypothetical protein P5V15_003028 [Pogonomyrmex californicus]